MMNIMNNFLRAPFLLNTSYRHLSKVSFLVYSGFQAKSFREVEETDLVSMYINMQPLTYNFTKSNTPFWMFF